MTTLRRYLAILLHLNGYNGQNGQKGYLCKQISAGEIKQNSVGLQEALRNDLLITKRDKPFVVVMDYEKC